MKINAKSALLFFLCFLLTVFIIKGVMPTQQEAFDQPPISWEEIEEAARTKRIRLSQRNVLSNAIVNSLIRDLKTETFYSTQDGDPVTDQLGYTTSSLTDVDISGATLDFTLDRKSNVFVIMQADTRVTGFTGAAIIDVHVRLFIDDVDEGGMVRNAKRQVLASAEAVDTMDGYISMSYHDIVELDAGDHNVEMKWHIYQNAGTSGTGVLDSYRLSYVVLGK